MKPTPSQVFLSLALGLALAAARNHAQSFTVLKSFGALTNATGIDPNGPLVQGTDAILYGTTSSSDGVLAGTVFRIQRDGSAFRVLKWFTNSVVEGANPVGDLVISESILYGTTRLGGSSGHGTVFRMNTDGTGYTVLKNFAGTNGPNPLPGGLTLSENVLFGTTAEREVFKLNADGTGYTVVRSFASDEGPNMLSGLTLSGDVLYGVTFGFGSTNGTVFKLNTNGTGFEVLKTFVGSDGYPNASPVLSGNVLFGTLSSGGDAGLGSVYRLNVDGTGYVVLKSFTAGEGAYPGGKLTVWGNTLYGTTASGGDIFCSSDGTVFQMNTDGTGFQLLKSFCWGRAGFGASPRSGVVLSEGELFGTTLRGGASDHGTVFRLKTDGTAFTVLKEFTGFIEGANPRSGLTLSNGVLYGTTASGGGMDKGTVFRINVDGAAYTVLKNFDGWGGAYPSASLILSGDSLYGAAQGGLAGAGTVFALRTNGTGQVLLRQFSTLDNPIGPRGLALAGGRLYGTSREYGPGSPGTVFAIDVDAPFVGPILKFFTGSDGRWPEAGPTVSDDWLYGTTSSGGSSDKGTVFKLNLDGTGFSLLKSFTGSDGASPSGELTVSGDVLYGTTAEGGSFGNGTIFKLNADGTEYTVLKSFTGPDGASPSARLELSCGVLYGTTVAGGSAGFGTVFMLKTNGTGFAVLKNFDGPDGASPYGGLTMSGTLLYGTTSAGGDLGVGTLFKIDLSSLLTFQPLGNAVALAWIDPSWHLQSAPIVAGTYTNVPNATSPFTNAISGAQQFFRLQGP